ncbi:putative integral membrane protein [Erysiphe necator]|uniref:Putative integral membrane protein n=1 Tax=Uncinula necator TaxID=52586 RepID=A0A0B1P3Y9_UNCNE|nr:putative integral membrane protein [Erysiphe necator]
MDLSSDPRLGAFLASQAPIFAKQNLSEDRRWTTYLISYISIGVALLFLVLRLWARFRRSFGYGLDDWIIILAFCFLGGNLGCVIKLVQNGIGLHSGALTLPQVMAIGKILVLNEVLYVTNINLIKLSVLAMYYRFFPVRLMRLGGLILGTISSLWNVSLVVLAITQCVPFKKIYAPWVDGNCINLRVTFLIIAVPSILTDVAILSLPIPLVWKLQTKVWQKISLTAVFMLGSYVVFASIYRFTIFLRYNPEDLPYTLAPGLSWNMIELSSGIVSACLPTLGPFIRRFIKSIGDTAKSFGDSRNSHIRSGAQSRLEDGSKNKQNSSTEASNAK